MNAKELNKQAFSQNKEKIASRRLESQKVVTFYRDGNNSRPELRMIINSRKDSLNNLIQGLTRVLNLKDDEQHIFKINGERVSRIEEFEDGGSYVFSNEPGSEEVLNALTLVEDIKKSYKVSQNGRRKSRSSDRMIKVITNENSSDVWNISIDENKLMSFSQLLLELNRIIQPEHGRVAFLCTNKGRRVRGLLELFNGTDTFVAIINSIGIDKAPNVHGSGELDKTKDRKIAEHDQSKYDIIKGQDSDVDKKLITIEGKTHVFYPSTNKYSNMYQQHQRSKLPEQKLQLDWIYGYNGQKSNNNVHILKSEELVYYAASVVVIYDVCRNKQRYYTEHTMEITCMALHPNNWYVATGQAAPENLNIGVLDHIRIWNADYLNTLAILSLEEQTLSVSCLSFSVEDNGRKLATVDTEGNNYRLLVWDWNERKILAKSQSYDERELCVKFHPFSNKTLISVGNGHVFYWTWRGSILEKYKGHFFGCISPKVVNSLVFLTNGGAVTGDDSGNLHFWQEGCRRTKKVLKIAQKGDVQSLCVMSHDMLLSYCKNDKLLSLWEIRETLNEPTATIEISGDYGAVTSIAVSPNHHQNTLGNIEIFLGTESNQILRGTFKTQFTSIVKGHAIETTALASNPCYNHIATAGKDRYVVYRSADNHSISWEKKMEEPATALGFYPNGDVFAVGTSTGRWSVLKSKDGSHIASFQSGKVLISCISYASDGADVAIGTESGEVHLFSVYDEGKSYRMVATVQGSKRGIKAIDWSKDGIHLRTMTDNFQQNIWNTERLEEVHDLKTIADINWQTQKSTLSYNTSGIWTPGSDLRMLCCDWLAARGLLCVGTEYGHIRLFSYPCQNNQCQYREYSTHVSNVNHVRFLASEVGIVSSGQLDNTVMQWKIVFGNAYEQGIRNGVFQRRFVDRDVSNEGRLSSRRTTKLGHRRVRSTEPCTMTSEQDLLKRSSSVSPRQVGIENLEDRYPNKQTRMDAFEIQKHLKRTGTCGHILALQKSRDFVRDYNVVRPVSKERRRKKSEDAKFPRLGRV